MLGGLEGDQSPANKASQCPRVSGNLIGRSSPYVPLEVLRSRSCAESVTGYGSIYRKSHYKALTLLRRKQGAALMSKFGVNVPRGVVASTPAEAAVAARDLAPDGGEVFDAISRGHCPVAAER